MSALLPHDLDQMLANIEAEWEASQTPSDLRQAFCDFVGTQRDDVDRLRALLAATIAWWIIKGVEAGHDQTIVEQVALQQTQHVIAHVAWTMKRRQGEPFSPARIAIVAYMMAGLMAESQPKEIDLDGLTKTLDAMASDTEAENARLRELIDEIADMDLGEPEIEHREIIARCRTEQRRWTESDEESERA